MSQSDKAELYRLQDLRERASSQPEGLEKIRTNRRPQRSETSQGNRIRCCAAQKMPQVDFQDWQSLFNVLSPKRYELLQYVHRLPEPSVRALSRALDRDFKRDYEDVKALVEAGLLEHDAEGLRAEYEATETAIPLQDPTRPGPARPHPHGRQGCDAATRPGGAYIDKPADRRAGGVMNMGTEHGRR